MYRRLRPKEVVGKTIKSIDTRAENFLIFHFTDGSKIELQAEYSGISGLYIVCVDDEDMPKK